MNVVPQVQLTQHQGKFISLIMFHEPSQIRKDLHCLFCGRIVCQYYDDIRVVIFGEVREMKNPHDVMCSRCKTMYRLA